MHADDEPRSLRYQDVLVRRRAMLEDPHVAALTLLAAGLRKRGLGEVPNFDPLDGGVAAKILFLFEKPGPMTASDAGSGFISRNNDDPSAEATFHFMRSARIPRKWTIAWNVIPWWNFTRKVTAQELHDGAACVQELIELLPDLGAVVMVGNRANRARVYLESTGKALFRSSHPSPLVKAKYPSRWSAIPLDWAAAMKFVREQGRLT